MESKKEHLFYFKEKGRLTSLFHCVKKLLSYVDIFIHKFHYLFGIISKFSTKIFIVKSVQARSV